MRKTDAFRRAAALLAALSITVSLAAPAFAATSRTYYIDKGDITITKDEKGQTVKQGDSEAEKIGDDDEIIITTTTAATTTQESDLEGPAAEDSGFGPVVEDNYQPVPPAQPENAEEPKAADRQESTEEPKGADQQENTDRQESADQQENTDRQENAEEPKDADQPEDDDQKKSTEESEDANRQENAEESEDTDRQKSAEEQESAGQQPQPQQAAPAAAPAAPTSVNGKGNGVFGNTITVINNFADKVLKLTLRDVKIDVSGTGNPLYYDDKGNAALSVQGEGDVEIELDGKNELKSGAHRAGLEKNTSEGTLTLKDDNKEAGSLTATGGEYGAGIGGGDYDSGENITITGGTVTATGGEYGAGIGGGRDGSGKNITITGGTVTATGGEDGAGIGGGADGSGEDITITRGTVNATGGHNGAGIGGGGNGGGGKNITINGGAVNAEGDDWGAGIGGGGDGSGEDITITDGTVTAKGGALGAGIGGSGSGSGKNITITGGTVNASGGAGAGIGGGVNSSGSNVTVSGAAQVTATASKCDDWDSADTGATIGNGGSVTEDGDLVNGEEIQADIIAVTTGYIHHIIYNEDGTTIKREWWEPERPQPNPESPQPNPDGPNAPAGESNEVDLGTPWLHVETLEGDLLPFEAQQQGSTLRVTSDNLSARLHGTRQALEALQEQGVEQIQFVTTLKTTTLPVAELLAEGGSWFALEHDGLGSRRLSAAQAESLKCWMH
jgi:hypothetical protein